MVAVAHVAVGLRSADQLAENRNPSYKTMAKTRKNRSHARKTRKAGGRGKSDWNMLVKRTFAEMRRKDRKASFGDALKEASRRKARGEL